MSIQLGKKHIVNIQTTKKYKIFFSVLRIEWKVRLWNFGQNNTQHSNIFTTNEYWRRNAYVISTLIIKFFTTRSHINQLILQSSDTSTLFQLRMKKTVFNLAFKYAETIKTIFDDTQCHSYSCFCTTFTFLLIRKEI